MPKQLTEDQKASRVTIAKEHLGCFNNDENKFLNCIVTGDEMWVHYSILVRLSLLAMTNPNQLCDVLLFVCSKMADETSLSSKLPVADRTREV